MTTRPTILGKRFGPLILELDLLNPDTFQPGLLIPKAGLALPFVRPSTAYRFNASGGLESVSANVPRLDYDPTATRKNWIRNNSMQGAAAGTPGTVPTNWSMGTGANGITREIVGVGTEDGIDYIDVRFSGTASDQTDVYINTDSSTLVPALATQVWTFSAFFKLVSGVVPTNPLRLMCSGRTSNGGDAEGSGVDVGLGGALQRTFTSRAMTSASTVYALGYIRVRIGNGEAVDFTVRIGMPQLELASSATAVIRTINAAVGVNEKPLGYLSEGQRTNSIRNNSMQGASAGSPGTLPTNWSGGTGTNGISRQVVGTGIEDGIDYIDVRYSGTASALTDLFIQPEGSTVVAAATGQTWTFSSFIKLVGGALPTTPPAVAVSGRTSGGADNEGVTANAAVTAAALGGQRFYATKTLNVSGSVFVLGYVRVRINNAEAVDFTLRIGMPQLENGATPSSVLRTTTAAVTRSADVAAISVANLYGFDPAAGSAYAAARIDNSTSAQMLRPLWALDDGTGTDRMGPRFDSGAGNMNSVVVDGGVTQVSISSSNWTYGSVTKTAFAWAVNDFASSANGAAAVNDLSGTLPGQTILRIARRESSDCLYGWLTSFKLYNRRLPNTELQGLTA